MLMVWPLADYEAIEFYLSGIDWYNMVVTYPSASVFWDTFMSVLYTAVELYVYNCINVLSRNVVCGENLESTSQTQLPVLDRECVNQWRSLIQQQLTQTEEKLVKSNNIGSFYKFVNKRISCRSGIPPIINDDHVTVTDNQAKAGLFNEYFASVGRPDNGFIPSCSSNTDSCVDGVESNESNVLASIRKLKNNYTNGPNRLLLRF